MIATLTVWAALLSDPAGATFAPRCAVIAPQIQDDSSSSKQPSPTGGGTPEPATLLLLAGSALGYGVVRRMRRGSSASKQTEAN